MDTQTHVLSLRRLIENERSLYEFGSKCPRRGTAFMIENAECHHTSFLAIGKRGNRNRYTADYRNQSVILPDVDCDRRYPLDAQATLIERTDMTRPI
jgi:hypothetical protein